MNDSEQDRAARFDTVAEMLESIGPLILVLGILAAIAQLHWSGVLLVAATPVVIFTAAFLRECAARRRESVQARADVRREQEASRNRMRAEELSFVLTDERLTALRGLGAGRDLILALRHSRNTRLKIRGERLLSQLDRRIGPRRTDESLPLVIEYLVDRRKRAR